MITFKKLKEVCQEMKDRNMTNPSGMAQVLLYHIQVDENK